MRACVCLSVCACAYDEDRLEDCRNVVPCETRKAKNKQNVCLCACLSVRVNIVVCANLIVFQPIKMITIITHCIRYGIL